MITDSDRVNFLLAQAAFASREAIDAMMVSEATGELTEPVRPHEQTADENHPPLRYCTRCQKPIDPKRVMRGSSFCGNDCRREDMKQRRAYKASKACRLCGRAARRVRPKTDQNSRATAAQPELTPLNQEGATA